MSYSIDVNLLLYASDTSNPLHERTKNFLDARLNRRDVLYLGWPTIMGYLRIITHPSIFDNPLTSMEATTNVESLLNRPNTRCLVEESGFWETYRTTTEEIPTRGSLVPDAHLAALLWLHGVRTLYTHDRDFRKFGFLEVIDPLE